MPKKRQAAPTNEGWAKPSSFTKYHYFAPNGISLCSHFRLQWQELVHGNDDSPDNCNKCRELRAKATTEQLKTKGPKR